MGTRNTRALKAFAQRAASAREHCAHIIASLDEYEAQPDEINWGYVGCAGYVKEQLEGLAAFLDGSED